jgi:beta-glucanase (GH16 family)
MRLLFLLCPLFLLFGSSRSGEPRPLLPLGDTSGYYSPSSYRGYTLVWDDEFNGTAIDDGKWMHEVIAKPPNNELEYYTANAQNSYIDSGMLVIEALQERMGTQNYTSARMDSKAHFTYGRIDIRAKLPVAQGMWPALWTLGTDISTVSWPACGEIDIMELIGPHPARTYGTIHWLQANKTEGSIGGQYDLPSGDFSQKFHVFSLIWKADSIQMLVDDNLVKLVRRADVTDGSWAFNDNPQYILLNVAVGGDFPGPPGAATFSSRQRMFVDYVRVFQ